MPRSWCKEEREYIIGRIKDIQAACLRLESLGYIDACRNNLLALNNLRYDLGLARVKHASDALIGVENVTK